MIKNIFLPNRINNYYLFGQKIIAIDISRTAITASLAKISGNKLTILKNWSQSINLEVENGNKNIIEALNLVLKNSPKVNEIICGIPSSLTIFKNLELPLTSRESINLVLKNEISKSLPFSAEDANIDFIITKKSKKNTELISATTQKSNIEYLQELFKEINYKTTRIIPNAIGAYFYLKSKKIIDENPKIIVGINYSSTTVYYIENKILKQVRTFPKGIINVIKNLDQNIIEKIQSSRNIDNLNELKISEGIDGIISDIMFTISSIVKNIDYEFILLPTEFNIANLATYFEKKTNKKILDLTNEKYLYSQGLCYSILEAPEFNLISESFNNNIAKKLVVQIIVGLSLTTGIIGSLALNNFLKLKKINEHLKKEQIDLKNNINKNFKNKIKSNKPTEKDINKIKQEIKKQEETWMPYSIKNKFLYLNLLKELTKIISSESKNILVEELKFNPNFINLKAKANSFDSLINFEKSIEDSKIFTLEAKPQTTDFDVKILFDLNKD